MGGVYARTLPAFVSHLLFPPHPNTNSVITSGAAKKGPEPMPGPISHITTNYCVGGTGLITIGFGASGAFGAVNPGITGACPITPVAAA